MQRPPIRPQKIFPLAGLANLLIAAQVFAGYEASAATTEYCVQGTIRTKTLIGSKNGGLTYPESTVGFEMFVADGRWLMTLGSADLNLRDSTTVSCDGEDTFMLLNYETRIKIRTQQKLSPVSNVGDATARRGTVPSFEFAPEAGALWLAYASGPTLANSQSGSLLPVPFAGYASLSNSRAVGESDFLEEAVWATNGTRPYLPRSIHYVRETDPGESHSGLRLTNVIYRTVSFMEVGGLSVPGEASVVIQRYDSQQTNDAVLQLCNEFHMVATNVAIGKTPPSFMPALPHGKTLVTEQRLNNGNGLEFSYFIETNWLSRASVSDTREYIDLGRTTVPVAPANRIMRLLPFTLILVPLVFWLGRYLRARA